MAAVVVVVMWLVLKREEAKGVEMHTPETLAERAEISSGGSRMRGKKKVGKREWGAGNLIAESEWIQ